MKFTQLFTKTQKEAPKDEVAKNAQLLIRAGFVYKEMAGVYTLLPLGVRSINKLAAIIREEMNAIDGVEMQSAALQRREVWEPTNRWSDEVVDNWFKTSLASGTELGLAFTHEEPLAAMMKSFVSSYKDLPAYPYDIRTVFRNEARAKSGLMRGREFFWKALYSFSASEDEHVVFYEQAKQAYMNVFERAGIGSETFLTFASGGSFSKFSHEFQTISEAGEDTVYVDRERGIAVNKEVYTDEVLTELGLNQEHLEECRAIETGNIFTLGTKFSEPAGLLYKNKEGELQPVFMGSYGIGISRLLGVIAELHSDETGLLWPKSVAPFQVHLVAFGGDDAFAAAHALYIKLTDVGVEVLYDDRPDARPGQKLADADLMGMPLRVVSAPKALQTGGFEVKRRSEDEARIMTAEELLRQLAG